MNDAKVASLSAQARRLAAATPDEKLRAAAEQRRIATELVRAGLRARFPGLDEEAIEFNRGELTFGSETWRMICERRQRRR
jgi:hypothetical protein